MSGYFAGLMRQTGLDPAATPPSPGLAAAGFAGLAAAAPPEEHVWVDAVPTPSAAPSPSEAAPAHLPPPPAVPSTPSNLTPPPAPVAGPPIRPSEDVPAHPPAPPTAQEVVIERVAAPRPSIPVRGIEQTVPWEAEPPPAEPPVRAIPSAPSPPSAPDAPRTTRVAPAVAVSVAADAPPPPARVHSFAEVLAEARRWVAETPAPDEPRRPAETALVEVDGVSPAPRPRRQAAGTTEASEEVHVSIGAITVTIEDPAATRPAPRAETRRPEPDRRSRLSRVYLRPE